MKLVMVSSITDRCGIAIYSKALARALSSEAEVQVRIIEAGAAMRQCGDLADRANNADIVHIQHEYGLWDGYLERHYLKRFITLVQRPIVFTLHTTAPRIAAVRKLTARRIAARILDSSSRFSDYSDMVPFLPGRHCIVHTKAGKHELIERGAQADYIHVRPLPAYERATLASTSRTFRMRFGIPAGRIISVFGFITRRKDYDIVLQALKQLPQDIILVIGGGPRTTDAELYEQELRARIANEGLQRRVTITGFLSEVEIADLMAATEIVVIPETYLFGASGSVMMALSYGKAVVASDLDCFNEIQSDVPCLRLFRASDTVELGMALRSLLEDATARTRLEVLALRYAMANDICAFARSNLEIYKLAIEESNYDTRRPRRHFASRRERRARSTAQR